MIVNTRFIPWLLLGFTPNNTEKCRFLPQGMEFQPKVYCNSPNTNVMYLNSKNGTRGGLNLNKFKDSTTNNIDHESMKPTTHFHGDFSKFSEIYVQH